MEAEEEWLEKGHAWLGARLRRFFDVGASDGVVTRWLPPARGSGESALWHMVHDDGDEEDLEAYEVRRAMRALERNLSEETDDEGEDESNGSSMEEEEEEEEEEELAGAMDAKDGEVEVILSRRWASRPSGGKAVEYLVKWKGRSYFTSRGVRRRRWYVPTRRCHTASNSSTGTRRHCRRRRRATA